MKKYLILFTFSVSCSHSLAQSAKKPISHKTGTAAVVKLNDQTDSLSYSIGLLIASFYKQQGITHINQPMVNKAITDKMNGGNTLMTEQQCNQVLMAYVEKVKGEKASVAKKEGIAFLAENKTKPGVITTASGLQYVVLKEGTGPKPAATDKVKCNYEGKLLDGTVFDSSVKQGHPIEFNVNGVIPGWTEALQLMNTGSKYRLFIPSSLAYGDQPMGQDIKPGSTLIFDVELLEIVK
jgi:FKBP-type peptidyl-prolyl cis-trans isomerase FklB